MNKKNLLWDFSYSVLRGVEKMNLCAFDIGGTSIKFGILTDNGDILFKSNMDTEAKNGGLFIIEKVISKVKELKKSYELDGVAISTAGQIDSNKGYVVYATDSIPGYTGVRIKDIIEEAVNLPVTVDNDVNCAALGEYWKGVAAGYSDFICMTLGTGIGGAIILNGKINRGASFSAGEFGHINLYPKGKSCSCGSSGCYERYASSKALSNLVKEKYGYSIDLKEFFDIVRENDKMASLVLEQWVQDLVLGLKSIVHIFNPKLIVIGGGISKQGSFLLEKIKKELSKNIMPSFKKDLALKLASCGNDANLLGAVYNFISNNELNLK